MKYYRGNYFVRNPLINPENYYDFGHIIDIGLYPEDCPEHKLGWYAVNGSEEWNRCIDIIDKPSKPNNVIVNGIRFSYTEKIPTLKPKVISWLNEYVPESTDKNRSDMKQGWMIYHPNLTLERTSVSVFFLRRIDALAFKLAWG